jgi:hypothetical protein
MEYPVACAPRRLFPRHCAGRQNTAPISSCRRKISRPDWPPERHLHERCDVPAALRVAVSFDLPGCFDMRDHWNDPTRSLVEARGAYEVV